MTPTTKKIVLDALNRYLGDDHIRARTAFRGLSPSEMNKQHGQSGCTRQQILDDYESHATAVEAAIKEIQEQPCQP